MQPPRKLGRKKEEQHRGPLAPSYPIAAITILREVSDEWAMAKDGRS